MRWGKLSCSRVTPMPSDDRSWLILILVVGRTTKCYQAVATFESWQDLVPEGSPHGIGHRGHGERQVNPTAFGGWQKKYALDDEDGNPKKVKALVCQRRDYFKTNRDPHIRISNIPGSGKSAILQLVYPKYYNKNLNNRIFDLYNPKEHTHVLLQDVDHETVEKLGV
ncbi:unnamed protein product [Phytophthora lilii]|uniref:Unnamed protein product n=1 Tax=Phytophthora lilii TaxID=2077276 RepID=A0A9W6WV17_9STRA|nr:unnamed protein product [Phytophthora lilii]